VIKVDCDAKIEQRWFGMPYEFIQEPSIAPKKEASRDEDDVYVIALLHNTRDMITEFVVFDGKAIDQGPISRTKLPVYIPYGLHGSFVPNLVFNADDVQRKWTAHNAIESKSWNKMNGGFAGLGIVYDLNQK
jgi:all-trans-8'-apo-beta-carotenal 15,15'-oxygenase